MPGPTKTIGLIDTTLQRSKQRPDLCPRLNEWARAWASFRQILISLSLRPFLIDSLLHLCLACPLPPLLYLSACGYTRPFCLGGTANCGVSNRGLVFLSYHVCVWMSCSKARVHFNKLANEVGKERERVAKILLQGVRLLP